MVTLEEAKTYLRVDNNEEDSLIEDLIKSSDRLVRDAARIEGDIDEDAAGVIKLAQLYMIAYLYEHREEADHHELDITLRALLFGVREPKF